MKYAAHFTGEWLGRCDLMPTYEGTLLNFSRRSRPRAEEPLVCLARGTAFELSQSTRNLDLVPGWR